MPNKIPLHMVGRTHIIFHLSVAFIQVKKAAQRDSIEKTSEFRPKQAEGGTKRLHAVSAL